MMMTPRYNVLRYLVTIFSLIEYAFGISQAVFLYHEKDRGINVDDYCYHTWYLVLFSCIFNIMMPIITIFSSLKPLTNASDNPHMGYDDNKKCERPDFLFQILRVGQFVIIILAAVIYFGDMSDNNLCSNRLITLVPEFWTVVMVYFTVFWIVMFIIALIICIED